ncbi:hypothetical protein [Mycolicibacterium sp.]|uniref:hypothetical protein n=1 Tax=Mycolicibacterium sp. TaxID=2320850 RepID=UPI001E140E37|nr:hypothetical protein [Mycolicibacterium sp.]MCB1291519.1 hypothetical protein [Mycobacterium sp.]MCB9410105.1 hypothetical protein [Mycolicibacterium sp.]
MQPHSPMHRVTGPPRVGPATHAARPTVRTARLIGAVAAACALLAAVGVGAASCLNRLGPFTSTPTSARSITVAPATLSGAHTPLQGP